MFIRQCFRTRNGKRHAYWALVESYRTEAGPRQRVVAWLGKLDEVGRLGVERAARESEMTGEQDRSRDGCQLALESRKGGKQERGQD